MTIIDVEQLATVLGGAAATTGDNAFGRCGPGTKLPILGNIYTPQCKAHDASVRGALANGASRTWAQVQALPLLPAAVGSWFKAKLSGK